MKLTNEELLQIVKEELDTVLYERCQKGYKTHKKRKTKKMFGRTYRNCVKAEEGMEIEEDIDEAKAYHWDEPDWFYGGGYGDDKINESIKDNLDKYTADDFGEWYAQVQKYLAAEIKSGLFDPKKEEPGAYRSYVDGYTTSTYEEEWLASKGLLEKKDGKGASDPGYSLRDWFKGGGWKQTGGKYDGKPCAKQPGQKTKPYCRDPDDRAKMSKKERDKRAAKKRKKDPNPDRKGKAKNVSQKDGRKKK